jgi:hypothetical protein
MFANPEEVEQFENNENPPLSPHPFGPCHPTASG